MLFTIQQSSLHLCRQYSYKFTFKWIQAVTRWKIIHCEKEVRQRERIRLQRKKEMKTKYKNCLTYTQTKHYLQQYKYIHKTCAQAHNCAQQSKQKRKTTQEYLKLSKYSFYLIYLKNFMCLDFSCSVKCKPLRCINRISSL